MSSTLRLGAELPVCLYTSVRDLVACLLDFSSALRPRFCPVSIIDTSPGNQIIFTHAPRPHPHPHSHWEVTRASVTDRTDLFVESSTEGPLAAQPRPHQPLIASRSAREYRRKWTHCPTFLQLSNTRWHHRWPSLGSSSFFGYYASSLSLCIRPHSLM